MRAYYEHAGITIYHADCREVLPLLSGVDVTITDPPYGVSFEGKRTKSGGGRRAELGYGSDFVDDAAYIDVVVVPVIEECRRRFGRVVVMPGNRCMYRYPHPDDMGCVFNPSGAGLGPWGFTCFHPVLYYGKDPYLARNLGHRPTGIIDVAPGDGDNGHPCPKPLRWMRWLVQKASLQNELVLDPFMGSGTTLRAAKDLGRRCVGVEICEKYCEIATKRLSQEVFNFTGIRE